MNRIHPTSIIDPKAELGKDVQIGPYTIIESNVKIGNGTQIASHAVIAKGTTIGRNCKLSVGAVIGTDPQDLKFEDEETFVEIGDHTTIREYATINRATSYSYTTRVGNHCLIMAYAHVAHDCQLGNNVVIANAVNMAGHVIIEDFAGVGGLTAIHQFVRIGTQSFIGGGLRIPKDVPPYILAMGEPLTYGGLNSIGLKRRGYTAEDSANLKRAYKILYRENLTLQEAVQKIVSNLGDRPVLKDLIRFLQGSERGIIR